MATPRIGLSAECWRGRLGPYSALGQTFALRATSQEVLREAELALRPLERAVAATWEYSVVEQDDELRYVIYEGTERVGMLATVEKVLAGLFWLLDRKIVEGSSDDRLLFHSGAVEGDRGAVLLPGVSGSGKSTTTVALVRRGLRYLTDEIAAVSVESLEVLPYRKPVFLKQGSWSLFQELGPPTAPEREDPDATWPLSVATLGSVAPRKPAPIAAIVFPQYSTTTENAIGALSPVDAFPRLLQTAFEVPGGISATAMRALADLSRRTPCYEMRHCNLDWAVEQVLAVTA